jgi:glutaminase
VLGSKRARSAAERAVLAAHGDEAVVYRLQGELAFAGAEAVIRGLVGEPPEVRCFVLDFARVATVEPPSARLLVDLHQSLVAQGRAVALAGLARHPRLLRLFEETRAEDGSRALAVFDEWEAAVEWCEDALLAVHGETGAEDGELPLAEHELLRGLDADQLELVASLMERRAFAPGEMAVRKGDPAEELFLLVGGGVSVLSDLPDGRLRRLATLSPGQAFGEPAALAGATRTAFVRADRHSVCFVLKRASFDSLETSCPPLKIRLLENLLRSATGPLGRLSFEAIAERM